ncbi:BON domain-containing protein [Solimonas soli]|uniref:BON domain-containing protein n=1 Tax=Solimonas soli TaxID=413479 RepID=UPI0004BC2F0A|nr:BON domain-containing protein [Solimonas soli]
MRRPFSRHPDDYERRRRDPVGGGHQRGAHGYGGAGSNDSDLEPPGGSWGNREVRHVDSRGAAPGGDEHPRWRRDDWDEDRYGYPEATSYAREMHRGRDAYQPEGRFAQGDEGWRDGGIDFEGGRSRGQAHAPDGGSGHGYRRRDEWQRRAPRDEGRERGDDRDYGSLGARRTARFGAGPAAGGVWRAERGPKGYTRSDERIRDDVCERLYHEPGIDVREVSVQVQDGRVILEGTVPDRAMKHRIEDLCERCIGVRDIEDRIRVERVSDAVHRAEASADQADDRREAAEDGRPRGVLIGSRH